MNEIKEYIKGLEIVAPDNNLLVDYSKYEFNNETPSFLNFKGLNSFSENVKKETQEDVLNSLLLAQRAASKAFPDDNQLKNWYALYFEVLKKLGWLISQKDFSVYEEKSTQFELDKAIFNILAELLTGQQIKILMKSLELLKSLGNDDKRLIAFENNTHMHDRGNFQLGMTEETNGNVSILGSGFILESEKKITKVLFLKFDKEKIKLNFSYYKADLVSSIYENHREAVKQKLGDASQFIASLDI